MANKKSDVKAKAEFIKILNGRGFDASVVSSPADIKATKDNQTWYFEIKMTKRPDTYFGAATLTEWKQAIADPDHFRFVVAKTDDAESRFEFLEFTPEQFMQFSTIPPFKVYFNLDFDGRVRETKKATRLTKENLKVMSDCFDRIKGGKAN